MKTLLLVNSSGRSERSVTRHLVVRFAAAWAARHPQGEIIGRDVGLNPPPPINESWIAASHTDSSERTPVMHETLTTSEALIDEIFRATTVVVGAPMYNFGMPAQLKAYVDQIVRVGCTFAFGGEGAWPYQPLVPSKPLVIISSMGAGGYEPGGPMAHLNFLEPHLEAAFRFIGFTDFYFVRVSFEENKDERFKEAMADAEIAIEKIVDRLAGETCRIGECDLIASPAAR
jgi:FMN-dependent NADH-azoreductase